MVKSSLNGDQNMLQRIVKAIIAEERSKKHTIVAQKLEDSIEFRYTETNIIKWYRNGSQIRT